MSNLAALARAAEALGRRGDLTQVLQAGLDQLCFESPISAARLRLIRDDRVEHSLTAGDQRLVDEGRAGFVDVPLEWAGDRFGVLHLFLQAPSPEGPSEEARATATLAGRLFSSRVVSGRIDAARRAEAAVRKLSGRLLHLQDEERRRIARSLHESAAQTVAALSMNLQRMERLSLPAPASEKLAESLELVTQVSREIRTLSHLLHPPLLEEAGLPSSLRWYVQGFGTRSNVAVSLELADDVGRLPMELEITLFRVVQESLTNVHRHANARRATVRMRRSGPEVLLEIEDDGHGMPPDVMERVRQQTAEAVGVGIAGMRERLSQLGGALEVESSPRGTLVRARLRSDR
jgi:signal transduction histidine kinase